MHIAFFIVRPLKLKYHDAGHFQFCQARIDCLNIRTSSGIFASMSKAKERRELGSYIVADPEICHGKPTFKGTQIMVWQVLEDVADGRSWEFICNTRWGGRIPLGAVAEAIRLAGQAWIEQNEPGRSLRK